MSEVTKRREAAFRLDDAFIEPYKSERPPFGFGALGELIYLRTYSRVKPDGRNEAWWETVRRVVEGCYRMQERHIKGQDLGWSEARAQNSAREMFDRMFKMKFLPPGRGLWAMGTALTEEKGLFAALNNCAFVSTDKLDRDPIKPFTFLMDMSMLGVGVGFDTKGQGKLRITTPSAAVLPYGIPDTREGWVESVALVLSAYFQGGPLPEFDYAGIREPGVLIAGFGGLSSGPQPLFELHLALIHYLEARVGQWISAEDITTIQNLIGVCVVAGNVRRTAEIAFGEPDDEAFMALKDYRWNKHTFQYEGPRADRAGFGYTSNNSIFAKLGMDYAPAAARTALNGEPGYEWLENARAYSRMGDVPDWKDKQVAGANPCVEQSLFSYELCCLVETFPFNHDSLEDYQRTLKMAYLYAKTVTLGRTHWTETNRVMLKNRRIGCSMSGVQQFVAKWGLHALKEWCEAGYEILNRYDRVYSDWFCVPTSIKKTSIKPSGTVSLLAGATPGMHWPEYAFYIRRFRLSIHSELIQPLQAAGYPMEPAVGDPYTVVVEVPVAVAQDGLRTVAEVSLWEQLAMAAFLQRYWADNQVSSTVTFDPETEGLQIAPALAYYQYQLKGISFLPKVEAGAYAQMPYEAISVAEYEARTAAVGPVRFGLVHHEAAEVERFCDGGSCQLVLPGGVG